MYIIKDTTNNLYFCTEGTVNYWHKDNTTAVLYDTIEQADKDLYYLTVMSSIDNKEPPLISIEPIYNIHPRFLCKDKDTYGYICDTYNTEGDSEK
jgi:hypothetical protein